MCTNYKVLVDDLLFTMAAMDEDDNNHFQPVIDNREYEDLSDAEKKAFDQMQTEKIKQDYINQDLALSSYFANDFYYDNRIRDEDKDDFRALLTQLNNQLIQNFQHHDPSHNDINVDVYISAMKPIRSWLQAHGYNANMLDLETSAIDDLNKPFYVTASEFGAPDYDAATFSRRSSRSKTGKVGRFKVSGRVRSVHRGPRGGVFFKRNGRKVYCK